MSTAVVRRPPSRRELLALNVIGTAGFFVIWHLLAVSGWFPSRFLPSPLEVVRMIVQLAQSPYSGATLWGHLGASLARFFLAQRRGRLEPLTLLLVGVIVNAINGALFLLLFSFAKVQDLEKAFRFLSGALQTNLAPAQTNTVAVIFFLSFAVLLLFSGQLNISMLSESEAQSLGVRINRLRWASMIVASLATAAAMAISGPIGFVGLVCPHLARLIVGNDQRRLLPVATTFGAILLAIAEAASRRMGNISVGVLTGFLGGPFFLFLLWQNRKTGGRA
jgi:iron complex transport system permease protein